MFFFHHHINIFRVQVRVLGTHLACNASFYPLHVSLIDNNICYHHIIHIPVVSTSYTKATSVAAGVPVTGTLSSECVHFPSYLTLQLIPFTSIFLKYINTVKVSTGKLCSYKFLFSFFHSEYWDCLILIKFILISRHPLLTIMVEQSVHYYYFYLHIFLYFQLSFMSYYLHLYQRRSCYIYTSLLVPFTANLLSFLPTLYHAHWRDQSVADLVHFLLFTYLPLQRVLSIEPLVDYVFL